MSMNGDPGVSSNGVPTNHFPLHNGHALPVHQPSPSRDQWSQMVPQNQPQQFYGSPWQQSQPVQLPQPAAVPQTYPSQPQNYQNHGSTPLDFSSVVSQQIMQDFLRLSTPVGSSPNDDTVLAQALYESKQTGKTYRQALEGLHGVNNHAANLWKDYYLDHHDRFDLLVSRLASGHPKTVKKPVVSSKPFYQATEEGTSHQVARKRHLSPQQHTPTTSPPRRTLQKRGRPSGLSQASRRTHATPPPVTAATSALARPPKRPRATFNSISAPLLSNDVPNLMPPQVHIPLPDPPSRSPTPPVTVQVGTNGNKYTKEDREYFINFLLWRLKQEPSLTKREICELLQEKVPHHTVNSWASHWHQRHDIADKIFATYHNSDSDPGDEDQQDEEEEGEVEAEIKDDQDDDDTMSANETSRDQKDRLRSEGTFSGDPDVDTEEDEADMGEPGSSFTRGDWCILARFIARNHWDEMSNKERWGAFTETYATKRPGRSWAEFYRKNDTEILKLSKKYSPEIGRGDKSQHGRSSRRKRRANSPLDEDGENETDDGES